MCHWNIDIVNNLILSEFHPNTVRTQNESHPRGAQRIAPVGIASGPRVHIDVLGARAVAMARARLRKEAPAASFHFSFFLTGPPFLIKKKPRPVQAATQRSRRHRERPRRPTRAQ